MKIRVREGLPFVTVTLVYRGKKLDIKEVLIDTGSAGSVFSADKVASIGLVAEPHDSIRQIRGVGGFEFVFARRIDSLVMGDLEVKDFEVEIGIMDYGFEIEGIIGMDFLIQGGVIIDIAQLEVKKGTNGSDSV
ncbi:retropepsin-like domain-containing protein [candidate division WOR-3 bacterium]|nr:retropepsin-like domain-containing protein [candidate division WOR-3 bacterium]